MRRMRPGAELEERVSVLEEELNHLRDELDTKIQGVRSDLGGTITEGLEQERQDRQTADEETKRIIKNVAIGGLHLEIVGLLWLILGVVVTSIPGEIATGTSLFPWVSRVSGGCS